MSQPINNTLAVQLGVILQDDYCEPLGASVSTLAKPLGIPEICNYEM